MWFRIFKHVKLLVHDTCREEYYRIEGQMSTIKAVCLKQAMANLFRIGRKMIP